MFNIQVADDALTVMMQQLEGFNAELSTCTDDARESELVQLMMPIHMQVTALHNRYDDCTCNAHVQAWEVSRIDITH